MKKMIELTLPEFAFVEGYRDDDELKGRNVILHTRTASVLEVFEAQDAFLNEDTLSILFSRYNQFIQAITDKTTEEKFVIALHCSATLDKDNDRDYIIKNVMKPAAMWYCDYCKYIDELTEEDFFKNR